MEQVQVVKQLRDQIISLTIERDAAVAAVVPVAAVAKEDQLPTGAGVKTRAAIAKSHSTKEIVTSYSRKYLDVNGEPASAMKPAALGVSNKDPANSNSGLSQPIHETI